MTGLAITFPHPRRRRPVWPLAAGTAALLSCLLTGCATNGPACASTFGELQTRRFLYTDGVVFIRNAGDGAGEFGICRCEEGGVAIQNLRTGEFHARNAPRRPLTVVVTGESFFTRAVVAESSEGSRAASAEDGQTPRCAVILEKNRWRIRISPAESDEPDWELVISPASLRVVGDSDVIRGLWRAARERCVAPPKAG